MYSEGPGDLVSRLIMGIIRATIWVMGNMNLLTKSTLGFASFCSIGFRGVALKV